MNIHELLDQLSEARSDLVEALLAACQHARWDCSFDHHDGETIVVITYRGLPVRSWGSRRWSLDPDVARDLQAWRMLASGRRSRRPVGVRAVSGAVERYLVRRARVGRFVAARTAWLDPIESPGPRHTHVIKPKLGAHLCVALYLTDEQLVSLTILRGSEPWQFGRGFCAEIGELRQRLAAEE